MVTIKTQQNLVEVPRHLVALVGVDNLCVYKTGNILIIAKDRATEKIREIVKQLKNENSKYL